MSLQAYVAALRSQDWLCEFSDCSATRDRGARTLEALRVMQRELDPEGYLWASIAPKGHGVPQPERAGGGRTGWPPGLLQDDSRELSRWLANHTEIQR